MRQILRFGSLALIVVCFALSAFASGSEEKSPEEKAVDVQKQATEEYNKGVKHIDKAKAIAHKGDSSFAYNYRATADEKVKKEFEKAVEQFDKAVSLDPTLKEAYNNLGYSYRKLGKLNESLSAYDKALAIDSTFTRAREYRGETYLAMGELEKAKGECEMLTQLKSPLADTLMQSINLYKLKQVADQMSHQQH